MPYIKQENRKKLEPFLREIGKFTFKKGDLTYCIYKLGIEYLRRHPKNYQNISDCIAAMNDSAAEFRRRMLDIYEDEKRIENGEIL